MNKTQEIQRSKLITSYGGVGSIIDTIDNLAYMIKPFDTWKIFKRIKDHPNYYPELIFKDQRLISRLHNIGFMALTHFFQPDDDFNDIKLYDPEPQAVNRMVTAKYSPEWFYCEKCHRLRRIDKWAESWGRNFNEPKCADCRDRNGNYRVPRLQQVRFMLASLENGELKDIPWDKLWAVRNGKCIFRRNGIEERRVWDFRDINDKKDVFFYINKGGSDLIDIYVKFPDKRRSQDDFRLTLAEIMNHYFVLDDGHVYQPVIRNANNVYFPYTLSSLYIPRHIITTQEVDGVIEKHNRGHRPDLIQEFYPSLSLQDIRYIIDNGVAPNPDYTSEEKFRLDEFDHISNHQNYNRDGVYQTEDNRLHVLEHQWAGNNQPGFINNIYLLKHLEVTSVQVAYSRLERVSPATDYLTGRARKQWFDLREGKIIKPNPNNPNATNITVGLHPTCSRDRATICYMPAVISRGEGFFVELNLSGVNQYEEKEVFTHTYAHLVMKELEFSCGYPLPSMNERLYILPAYITGADSDRYGFLIYSANGEAGSYGGISSLFDNHLIEKILINAIDLAEDCPNDPICESEEDASCFACVQIPETACELFNKQLNRMIFKRVVRGIINQPNDFINNDTINDNSMAPTHGITPGVTLG